MKIRTYTFACKVENKNLSHNIHCVHYFALRSFRYVTRFEKSHLPRTQHQDTLFTIKRLPHTLTNNSGRYRCSKLPGLLLLWLVSQACQTSMSARVAFKWLHIPLTSRQPAVIHHTTGWCVWPRI